MANVDLKTFGELIKSAGPTDEHRQKFGRSFLGTLLWQTFLLVVMLAALVVTVGFVVRAAKEDLSGLLWVGVISAVLLFIAFLFLVLPMLWRAQRERRLKATAIGGDTLIKTGDFRLYPYSEADRETFRRLDGADATILNWLRSARASVLYFSGASGVGKSSLLAASVLPKLRDLGWAVVETRLFDAPMEHLRDALLRPEVLFSRRPGARLSLRDLLEKAAEVRRKTAARPLLIVIDQFEEFLILHSEEQGESFAALLSNLVKDPIDGLRLLLVFRSDYRPLIFKLDLPRLAGGENWQELAPYDRAAAVSLLQGGGRELSSKALDALFRGLDRIEEAPGLYRPITLNMVGLVLRRMGHKLRGDPGQLIQSYLKDCLTAGESRDFAKPLLAAMITDAGTKEPRSEAELATLTGFEPWQVTATLVDLARQGLVRRLEGSQPNWEIAHDFLARTLGLLIGRLKRSIIARTREPLIATIVLLGWFILALVAIELSGNFEDREAFFYIPSSKSVSFRAIDDDKLVNALSHLDRVEDLRLLTISDGNLTNLEPLKQLSNLQVLTIAPASGITSLEPLKGLKRLEWFGLDDAPGLMDLEPLRSLTGLEQISLASATGITSLEPLKGLASFMRLNLRGATAITKLEPLMNLTNLRHLNLSHTRVSNLESLRTLTKLVKLDLSNNALITDLESLKGLTNLRELYISHTGITSLEPLKKMTYLRRLDLSGATRVTDVGPLRNLRYLEQLDVTSTGITSLEPLPGSRKIKITGASPELMATMR